ncbi:MAG TPA: SDR family oxidoreductase [Permianibacter sp.]|nr:SDR family oxidoreductase [Permianibacter sp.]
MQNAILITGAGRRVGHALALHLRAQGHAVIGHYHHDNPELQALRAAGVTLIQADFSNEHEVRSLVGAVQASTASLRAIVHNASAFSLTAASTDDALAQADLFYQVHVRSPYLISRELTPLLQACTVPHADIVHITDIYADKPNPRFDVYCASKAAAQNLALSFARSLAPKVKVNVIQPGPILFKEWHSDSMKAQVLSETLLGVEGGSEPICLAVSALLANPYQTGAVIAVDGGRRLG